jgi:hypothetical protein
MLLLDPKRRQYGLGPPLWIAQEVHDPATSRNSTFELAYWRWALEMAQRWRVRSGLARDARWDDILAKLPPLPQKDGKYVALESHPDTWDNLASRHDHPEMLMALGFLPETGAVDRATMARTLDAVLAQWDWETKIWGWDYPMIAMTATRLGRPEAAVEVLLRDGPNNRYLANGHCLQPSHQAPGGPAGAARSPSICRPTVRFCRPSRSWSPVGTAARSNIAVFRPTACGRSAPRDCSRCSEPPAWTGNALPGKGRLVSDLPRSGAICGNLRWGLFSMW